MYYHQPKITDISMLNSSLVQQQVGVFTTTHTVNYDQNSLSKIGKVCSVTLNLTLKNDVSRYTTVATIPDGFAPANNFFVVDGDVQTGVLISSAKKIQFTKDFTKGKIVAFNATYLTN